MAMSSGPSANSRLGRVTSRGPLLCPEGSRGRQKKSPFPRSPRGACARPPLPLDQLHAAAEEALEQVVSTRGRKELEASMHASDALAVVQLARGFSSMGVKSGAKVTAASLRVAKPMLQ